jgi:beta-lactamase regulating signal transducer with metallopeptidase domain
MNTLLNPFVTASAKGAAWLFVWSWQAAVLLACVWAGLKIFRVKAPTLRHQVWLFALIAVAAMPALSGVVQSLPLPQPSIRALSYAVELPRVVVINDAAPIVQAPAPAPSGRPSITKPIILSLSFAVWLWGMCAFVMRAAINGLRLHCLRAGARRVSLADLDCNECDCEALRAGKASLALSDKVCSPILLGVLRPMIVFPADIASWTSTAERRAMLRHELAHVERRDHYVNLFQTVFGAVFFFHPLARYAWRQLAVEREMACDDHVVGSGAEAESYAESIIKAAERGIGAPRGAHQLALFSARQILERRIEMILNKDRKRVIARKWKYLILPATLIAMLAWMLLPARLAKPGLAQQASGDLNALVAKYMGDSRNFDDLVETALTNPDPETRQNAVLRLYILEGNGSAAALVKLYSKSNDPMIKRMVIESLGKRGSNEQLATIAQTEHSPEFRQLANEAIKDLKVDAFEMDPPSGYFMVIDGKLRDVSGSPEVKLKKDPLISLAQRIPPPPYPPPPPSDAMTVAAGQELKPIVDARGDSVFDLLREAADANIRRDTSFFERVLDDDFRETLPNGETLNKAQVIGALKRLDMAIKKVEFDDLSVSGDERSSFATFLGTVYFQANGQDSTAQFRCTVNFIRRDGQLKIAAIQMTQKN